MPNSKISALPAASTPLAGTELVPIVQGGITEQVSIDNLTAGKTVPTGKLQASSTGEVIRGTTSGNVTTTGTNFWRFYDSVGAKGYIGYGGSAGRFDVNSGSGCNMNINATNGTMELATGNTTRFTLTNAGNFIQQQASTGVNFTANTPAAGMTSQLLNWYEEGTFTPTIASDIGSVTLSTAVGKYTRIGRQVTINANVTVNTTTASSNVYLASLPFTSASNAAGSFYGYSFSLDVGTPMMIIDSGSTLAVIQRANGLGSVATLGPRLQAGTVMYFSLTYFV